MKEIKIPISNVIRVKFDMVLGQSEKTSKKGNLTITTNAKPEDHDIVRKNGGGMLYTGLFV